MEKSKFRFIGNESNIGDVTLHNGDIIELTQQDAEEAITGGCGLVAVDPPSPPAPAPVAPSLPHYAAAVVSLSGNIEDL